MATSRRQIIRKIESLEPDIQLAFLTSIAEIRGSVELAIIVGFLLRGDNEAAIDALNIDEPAFRDLDLAIAAAYIAGGRFGIEELPTIRTVTGGRAVFRFDVRNPRAEAWIARFSSGRVTEIAAGQRAMIRRVLNEGMLQGRNPRQTALDIVGRLNRRTGQREGGLLGLTDHQAGFVIRTRRELSSGEPDAMRNYLTRELRDQRFDPTVKAAIRTGKPVNQKQIDRIATAYSQRLLRFRGETIARTESLQAFNAGNDESVMQAIESGNLQADQVTGEWDSAGDGRVRDTHTAMNGQRRAMGEPFVSPSGARMMHPGDTSLGASASEIVQCRCIKRHRVDFIR